MADGGFLTSWFDERRFTARTFARAAADTLRALDATGMRNTRAWLEVAQVQARLASIVDAMDREELPSSHEMRLVEVLVGDTPEEREALRKFYEGEAF